MKNLQDILNGLPSDRRAEIEGAEIGTPCAEIGTPMNL